MVLPAARAWLKGHHQQVIVVEVDGRTVVPAFQIADGDVRQDVVEVNQILDAAKLDDWARWEWWLAGTSWLSGAAPIQLIATAPGRVRRAAVRSTARNPA